MPSEPSRTARRTPGPLPGAIILLGPMLATSALPDRTPMQLQVIQGLRRDAPEVIG